MLLSSLILLPLFGIVIISIYREDSSVSNSEMKPLKLIALVVTLVDLIISLIIWFLFDNSSKHFQFIQEHYTVGYYDLYLGLDGLSIYFVLLTTLIAPISIISNWKSINTNVPYFLIIILLLESALLLIYSVLDLLMFYIFFESILAPLFILIGFFGSVDKIRASFYFFLYTFLGSLFMLLSIITVSSLTGTTDMDIVYKTDFVYITQVFLFLGIFVAFAVKTPVIFLNSWLLKAHVESPLSGSVILAAIVLKLSLYGVFRLILPLAPKSFIFYTYIIFVICVITILYASFSTIRTIDVKELIAYSSVSHAAVYFAGILSNVLHGIQGGILLGLAHGFVSSGLFISGGGVLYDRSGTRTINYYGGLAQLMPIFSTVFFILCLGNCGAPLTLNFVGEFMSLYGVFERLSLAGILGSTSIVLSAAYTIFMFNRIILGGVFKGWHEYLSDLTKREYAILLLLVLFTVILGIYPSIILDTLNYAVSSLLFSFDNITMNASHFPDIGYHKTHHSRSFFEYVADNQPRRSDIAWNNTKGTHVNIYNPDISAGKQLVFDRNVAIFNPNSPSPNTPEYIGRPHNAPEHYFQLPWYVACFSGREETVYEYVDNTLPHRTYGYNNDFKLEDKFAPAKNTLPSHRFAYCNPANYK